MVCLSEALIKISHQYNMKFNEENRYHTQKNKLTFSSNQIEISKHLLIIPLIFTLGI